MPETVIAMVPARAGSERLKFKNLRMLGDKPVIAHAIDAARESGVFSSVVVNSDHQVFAKIAERLNVEFYARPEHLGSSETKSDDVIANFMRAHPGDILAWVNPIAPLQTAQEIHDVITYFIDEGLDTLITVEDKQVHCLYEGEPVNFSYEGLFAKTQDLTPVQPFVYSIMMWRYESFLRHYDKHGYALLSGKVGYFPVARESTVILKYEQDLRIAEAILKARQGGADDFRYDPVADEFLR